MLVVQKYGGSSLADDRLLEAAADRIAGTAARGNRVVVVVSAQGNTTDYMTDQALRISREPQNREMDAYLAAGEQMCAALMTMALLTRNCPAVSLTGAQACIRTDDNFGNAEIVRVDPERIIRELDRGKVVVVTGFQGISSEGDITTLGRGGSDTTAVALAARLHADRCLIFTDVDGIYDRDPHKDPGAVRYDQISYGQMLELIGQGAQVLQQRSVEMAGACGVRIEVCPAFREGPGTRVEEFCPKEQAAIPPLQQLYREKPGKIPEK